MTGANARSHQVRRLDRNTLPPSYCTNPAGPAAHPNHPLSQSPQQSGITASMITSGPIVALVSIIMLDPDALNCFQCVTDPT